MAIIEQKITSKYAIYNGDCVEVMKNIKSDSVHLTIYSPPFAGLYQYSSDERDMSNCVNKEEFFLHYEYCIREKFRITVPGRMSAVHCMDLTTGNSGCDHLMDFPGDIIRLHEKCGFNYVARYHVWKEPLTVRNRTMMKSLHHKTLCQDSTRCSVANADYLLIFRKKGVNPVPVSHPMGLERYAGNKTMPAAAAATEGKMENQLENSFSHWIWRRYADAFWDDVRIDRVLPYRSAKGEDDEKHVHPLQLDVIERACVLWSNPGEVVLTPFMGVGSETYGAVINNRRAIGIELKETYYRQAVRNMADSENHVEQDLIPMKFDPIEL
jgi:DNA modification methylase